MVEPETRLALRNIEEIARGSVLLVGFGPELLRALLERGDAVSVFHDNFRLYQACAEMPGVQFGPWVQTNDHFDAVVCHLPKSAEKLEMMLSMARTVLAPDGLVFLIGHNNAGIKSAVRELRALIGEPEVVDIRYHCRMYGAPGTAPMPERTTLSNWETTFVVEVDGSTFEACSYPGVFSHGRLDEGTWLLLSTLRVAVGARVLDLGCGSGVIAAWLGLNGVTHIDCVDVDALAVAATERTLALNDVCEDVRASDLYSHVRGPYTHVVTNAPFHEGVRKTSAITLQLIRETPEHLETGGELWLVANRFLDYMPALERAFGTVKIARENNRFRVYRARRSG